MTDNLFSQIFSYDNLELAFKNARKKKTTKQYVIEFEQNLKDNLLQLKNDLIFQIYKPKPLQTFILRDPKTRKISKSSFRDRIVHHALCNIISPILEKQFIFDSYANRIGKGTFKAIERFEQFSRKITKNFTRKSFVLKADIKHYFETVDHNVLLSILSKNIKDNRTINLIKIILSNYKTKTKDKGMPLGNLTSQFFANVYLNELDQFIKHKLKIKYYIRYVDDFVILNNSKEKLEEFKKEINQFLKNKLKLELHPEKSRIIQINRGTEFLGMRIFPYFKLLKKKNLRKFYKKMQKYIQEFNNKLIDYDKVYDFMEGWMAYAKNANTYNLRKKILQKFEQKFKGNLSTKELNKYLKNTQ